MIFRLTVLGAGYLGITHAACMASLGFSVLGVDTDAAKVDQLNAGRLAIYEPGLEELLRAGLSAGRLSSPPPTVRPPRSAMCISFVPAPLSSRAAVMLICPRCRPAWMRSHHCWTGRA